MYLDKAHARLDGMQVPRQALVEHRADGAGHGGWATGQEAELFLADLDQHELTGKCVYFVLQGNKGVDQDNMDKVLSSGEVTAPLYESIDLLLSEVHTPYLKDGYQWGKISGDGKEAFLLTLESLREHVQEAVSGIQGGTQLCAIDPELMGDAHSRPSSHSKVVVDEVLLAHVEQVIRGCRWARYVSSLKRMSHVIN